MRGCPPSSKNLRKVNSKKAWTGCLPLSSVLSSLSSSLLLRSLSGTIGSKLDVSVAKRILGMYGAVLQRRPPSKSTALKNGCAFNSLAPPRPERWSADVHSRTIKSAASADRLAQLGIRNVVDQFITYTIKTFNQYSTRSSLLK